MSVRPCPSVQVHTHPSTLLHTLPSVRLLIHPRLLVRCWFVVMMILLFNPAFASAASLDLATSVPLVRARQIEFFGDLGYVAQNMDGAALVDFRDPASPHLLRQFPPEVMQPLFFRVYPSQKRLFSADRFRGFVIYDISRPEEPTTVSVLALGGMTTGFDLTKTDSGRDLAVLSRAGQGLLAVDITDPTRPQITDTFTSGIELTRGVAVRDGVVYAADSSEGLLKVLRISDAGKFEPLYQVVLPGMCQSIITAGDYLVVGYGYMGLRIYQFPAAGITGNGKMAPAAGGAETAAGDSSSTPVLRLVCTTLRNRNRVKGMAASVGKHWLFTANEQMGIDMHDIENPAFPVLIGEYVPRDSRISVQGVTMKDDLLFAPAWDAGVLVFRIQDGPPPANFDLENLNK